MTEPVSRPEDRTADTELPPRRLFFALPLPAPIRDQLVELRDPSLRAAWVPADNLHLTLRGLIMPAARGWSRNFSLTHAPTVTCYNCMAAKDRMQDYRSRLRKQGLRPVQIWVPDQRRPGFRKALQKQIRMLDAHDERESLEFIAASGEWPEA